MKIISLLAGWCLLSASVWADEDPPRDWRSMNPDQLHEHVAKVTTLSGVVKLLGAAPRPSVMGDRKSFHYKVADNLTLVVICEHENLLEVKHSPAVRSIYLFERKAQGQRAIWKIFRDTRDLDGKFRSDQIDLPGTNTTEAEQAAS